MKQIPEHNTLTEEETCNKTVPEEIMEHQQTFGGAFGELNCE